MSGKLRGATATRLHLLLPASLPLIFWPSIVRRAPFPPSVPFNDDVCVDADAACRDFDRPLAVGQIRETQDCTFDRRCCLFAVLRLSFRKDNADSDKRQEPMAFLVTCPRGGFSDTRGRPALTACYIDAKFHFASMWIDSIHKRTCQNLILASVTRTRRRRAVLLIQDRRKTAHPLRKVGELAPHSEQ